MLKKFKKKFLAFFEGYFVELLKQQESVKNQLEQTQQQIAALEKKLELTKEELNNRILTTENNLNYYSMIRSIMDENSYVSNEIASLARVESDDPQILIAGFYGADNFGDEIMLQTLLRAFPKEMLSSVTVMLCDNPDYNYFHLPGVNFIHMPKKAFDCNLLAQHFDVLIWGGGALIDDSDFDKSELTLNNLFILLSQRFIACRKKVIALGLSSNQKLENPRYVEALKYVCSHSAFFSLRDSNSMSLLQEKGIENIEFLDDLVFFNDSLHCSFPRKTAENVPTVGIIWVCYEGSEELFLCFVKKIRAKFGENCKIKCIPFYNYASLDKKFFTRMLESIKNAENISIASYTNGIEEMLANISDTDFMVNMRYHGMFLCGMLAKPTFNVCYNLHRHYFNKISFLSEIFGMKESIVNYLDLQTDFEKIDLNFVLPNSEVKGLIKTSEELMQIIMKKLN